MLGANPPKKKKTAKKKVNNATQPNESIKIDPSKISIKHQQSNKAKPEPETSQAKNKTKTENDSTQPANETKNDRLSPNDKAALQMNFSGKLWTPRDFEIAYEALSEHK